MELKNILEYCEASGQHINCDKSALYFSGNTSKEDKEMLCEELQMVETINLGKYLGLQTIWGRSKREALSYVKEIVVVKLKGWKREIVSDAVKKILIRAVATSIPAYDMLVFKFPKHTCR